MPTKKQLALIPKTWSKHRYSFGASLLKGSHPKKKRPFSASLSMHVVLKSTKAAGRHSLLRHNASIQQILDSQAERHSIQVFSAANGGNHLHLLIRAPSRSHLSAFLRALSGRIAQLVMGHKKEVLRRPFDKKFWDARPFSRLVSWGQDFKNVCRYLGINAAESLLGFSRIAARSMDKQIQKAVESGVLRKNPGLVAAGFG